MDSDTWQQQVDEVVALDAICAENFSLLAFPGAEDGEKVTLEELLASSGPPPPGASPILCGLRVHVAVPAPGLTVCINLESAPALSSKAGPSTRVVPCSCSKGDPSHPDAPCSSAHGSDDGVNSDAGSSRSSPGRSVMHDNQGLPQLANGSSGHEERDFRPSTSSAEVDDCQPSTSGATSSRPRQPFIVNVGGKVLYLPPIILQIRFPPEYPSTHAPNVSMTSPWLTAADVDTLTSALLRLWQEQGPGMPVVFNWMEWLKENALQELGITSELVISCGGRARALDADHGPDEGAGIDPEQIALNVLRYSAAREEEAFQTAHWLCEICYDEMPGSLFVRNQECGHYFCRTCVTTNCAMQVHEGALDRLRCMSPKCRAPLSPPLLKGVLTEDQYVRMETLLLQRALDSMADVVYCPRCQAVCVEEPDHMAQCECLYVFCGLCSDKWHPGEPCINVTDRIAALEERTMRLQGGAGGSKAGAAKFKDLMQSLQSSAVIARTSRSCPGCRMATFKTEGCNKMTCTCCGKYWCWKCGQAINGYDHFRESRCTLWADAGVADNAPNQHPRWADINEQLMRGGFTPAACPRCHQQNGKVAGNNHIHCWVCQAHFCFLCRIILPRGTIKTHFSPSGCKQHTFD